MQDAGVRCSSCCLRGKDLALLAPAVQNFMENFKLEMKMLNRLMMDQQNTGVCGAGWWSPCDYGDADGTCQATHGRLQHAAG